ncbi:MAG: nicotinamide-nucleotide amidohydrolase family protein [Spirochaetales bacterium]|nr:nicotinamide-nucleotide amidohydrolase family protein [Spirochaetales bacterium]
MSKEFTASIIAIGTELSSGKIQDSHGKYLSSRLSGIGFSVDSIVLIPDNENIPFFIEIRKNKLDLVIITGGLGPTSDDITRDIIANAAGVDLVLDNDIWTGLLNKFPDKINESRKKQAYIPEGFTVLHNLCGTAPGFSGYIGSTLIFCLPGPPVEMRSMFENSVIPGIIGKFNLKQPETLTASCFLICESSLEDACVTYNSRYITWGTRVEAYKISLYLQGGTQGGRLRFLKYLQDFFGKELVIIGNLTAAELLFNSLSSNSRKISIAESVTGGLIGTLLTDIPGSSKVIWGSLVTYTNRSKLKILGIKEETLTVYGAVSREVTEEMATRVMELSGSDLSLSVSGYAGGSNDKDEDTGKVWIAVKNEAAKTVALSFKFSGSRDLIRRKTVIAALLLAETALTMPERLDSCAQWQYS